MEFWTLIASIIGAIGGVLAAFASGWQVYQSRPRRSPPMIHTQHVGEADIWPGWFSLLCTFRNQEVAVAEFLSVKVKSPANVFIASFNQNSENDDHGGSGWNPIAPASPRKVVKLNHNASADNEPWEYVRLTKPEPDTPVILEFLYRWSDQRNRTMTIAITI